MEIYGLTQRGVQMARSIKQSNTPEWKVINYLDKVPRATKEQIQDYTSMSSGQLATTLTRLKKARLVAKDTEVDV